MGFKMPTMEEMKALQIAEAQQSISPQRIPEYPVANTGANIIGMETKPSSQP